MKNARQIIYESSSTIVEHFTRDGVDYARKTLKPIKVRGVTLDIFTGYLCKREVNALKKLQGMPGVQQFVEQDSRTSFISLFENGESISTAKNVTPDYFGRLEYVLKSMHARGVVDIDFGHSTDILIDSNERPIVIDFGAAIINSPDRSSWFWAKKLLFEYIYRMNYKYLLKRKQEYSPEGVTLEEKAVINSMWIIPAIGKKYQKIRRYLKHMLA